MTLPEDLRHEEEIIGPESFDENWARIGEEVTEQLEHKPGEIYPRRIIRPKYALKKDLHVQQELDTDGSLNKTVKIVPLPLLLLPRSNAGAQYALEQIGLIYAVESMAYDQEPDYQKRAELRERLAYPILFGFERWIISYIPKALPKGRMSQALTYTYSLFHRLSRYHLDSRYRKDNNLVENTIRPLALGRKNYMFCGNHDTAENAAMMYSMLGCCAAMDVNPREWLTDVLTKIPYYNNDYSRDLADLLPHNWKAARELQKTPIEIQ